MAGQAFLERQGGKGHLYRMVKLNFTVTAMNFGLNKGRAQSGEKGLVSEGEVVRLNGQPMIVDPLLERWIQIREAGRADSPQRVS